MACIKPCNAYIRNFYRRVPLYHLRKYSLFNPTAEHKSLRELVRSFVESDVDKQAAEYNKEEKFNLPLFRKLGELGLLGVTVDPKYGGSGMDATAAVIVHEELASSDPGFCLSYLAHSMLFVNNLAQNGSEAQKVKYLPRACDGSIICGMGMSEPSAGTDVLAMSTTATPSLSIMPSNTNTSTTTSTKSTNSSASHYILNGSKMWITNGTIDGISTGDCFLIYAKTPLSHSTTSSDDNSTTTTTTISNNNSSSNNSSGKKRSHGISSFLVEKGMPGFTLGQKIQDKCGMRSSMTAEIVFDNVMVPAENIVGEVNQATLCMMRNLEIERITLAAMSLGIARRCIEIMNNYAQQRQAFGKPINNYGQIQKYITESYAEYMAGRSYVYSIANQLDLSTYGNSLDADGVKLYCSSMAKNVADRAIQVLGGYGYVTEYQVERLWRDSKLLEIGGGTNEAHHKNMIRDLIKFHSKLL